MRRAARLGLGALGLMWATTLWGCNLTPGEGRFDAERLDYGDCEENVMPWEPGFYTVDRFEQTVTIRLQDIGGNFEGVDGVFFQLDREYVAERRGQEIPMGLPAEDGEIHVRGTLGFFASCPGNGRVTPDLRGTIRFSRFEPFNDGQISARVTAPQVVDERTGEVIGENLEGEFSFLVQKGRPYTNFTGPGTE